MEQNRSSFHQKEMRMDSHKQLATSTIHLKYPLIWDCLSNRWLECSAAVRSYQEEGSRKLYGKFSRLFKCKNNLKKLNNMIACVPPYLCIQNLWKDIQENIISSYFWKMRLRRSVTHTFHLIHNISFVIGIRIW